MPKRRAPTPWFRMEANYPSHPRTMRMAWQGVSLFPLVLCLFKAQGWDGEADADDVEPVTLSRWTGMPLDIVEAGLTELYVADYLRKVGDLVIIPGWRKYQQDPTAAKRMRDYRKRQKDE